MTRPFPVTLTLDGRAGFPVRLELDYEPDHSDPRVDLTPDEARALAGDLLALADDWEDGAT